MKTLHITEGFRPLLYRSTKTLSAEEQPPVMTVVDGVTQPMPAEPKDVEDTVHRELIHFPSGCEEHIVLKESVAGENILITCRIQSSSDIMRLFMATDAVKRGGAHRVSAFIPYLPFARQDKPAPGQPLSIRAFADLLNAQNYHMVVVIEAHSEVAPAVINNCINLRYFEHIRKVIELHPEAHLCSPTDKRFGRVQNMALQLGHMKPVVMATRVRDLKAEMEGPIVIVDDICDDGYDHVAIADLLRQQGASHVFLAVTHGLFTKGVKHLKKAFDHIYTTDSFVNSDKEHPEITRMPL